MSTATKGQNSGSNEAQGDINEIDFVKIKIPENVRLIPKDLIESVKGRTFTPEQFYKYQEIQIAQDSPANLLYVLISKEKQIEGFLWIEISQLDFSMFVNTFSVNKKYWYKGQAMPKVLAFIRKLKNKTKCLRVFWISTNAKFFEKHGLKRSKNILLEYNEGKD
jgi:hypothetical protein